MQIPKKDRRMITMAGVLFLFTLVCMALFRRSPALTEFLYSAGLYPMVTQVMTHIWGWIPFSVTEVAIMVSGVLCLAGCVQLLRKRMRFGYAVKRVIFAAFILFCWFYWAWGFNYYRQPMQMRAGLPSEDILDSTTVAYWLEREISLANASYVPVSNLDKSRVDAEIEAGFTRAAEMLGIELPGGVRPGKTLFLNIVLDKTLTSGIFSPFFHEVHVNAGLLPVEYPFVLAHEKAHQMGIANEAEASFLAYIVCTTSSDSLVNYSGRLTVLGRMLRHASGYLAGYAEIRARVRPEIFEDFRAIRRRWLPQVGAVSRISGTMYDHYLKANKIREGRKNYGGVVSLVYLWQEKKAAEKSDR